MIGLETEVVSVSKPAAERDLKLITNCDIIMNTYFKRAYTQNETFY